MPQGKEANVITSNGFFMALKTVKHTFICGLLIVATTIGFSEVYLRHKGIPPVNLEIQTQNKISDPVVGWNPCQAKISPMSPYCAIQA